jgi:FHA domain
MPVCLAGHDSSAADFCDTCGMRIEGAAAGSASAASGPGAGASGPGAGLRTPGEPCPQCGTERSGQFCEGCGYDYRTGTPARTAAAPTAQGSTVVPAGVAAQPLTGPAWTAVVSADRGYFDRVIAAGGRDAATIEFPAYCPERRFPLAGKEMRIGRRSVSRGLEPEIDLTGPPADPGISHLHAVLVAQPGGAGWAVLDPGSSNGTQVNGADIEIGVAVPLRPGDRIHLGAWTALTIESLAIGPTTL